MKVLSTISARIGRWFDRASLSSAIAVAVLVLVAGELRLSPEQHMLMIESESAMFVLSGASPPPIFRSMSASWLRVLHQHLP